jgi:hypothetical protein
VYSVTQPNNAAGVIALPTNVARRMRIGRFVVKIMGLVLLMIIVNMEISALGESVVGDKN